MAHMAVELESLFHRPVDMVEKPGLRNNSYINLDDYKSRWYSADLGRFISPDDIIPDLNNPQSLNRYSYVGDSPCTHNDPDGHCYPLCSILAGAGIGALAGAAIYAATTAASGRQFNWRDLGIATATGAVGGALIGTGVGIGAGVAAFALVGAGTGALGSQIGYSIVSGKHYDSGEMAIAAATGAAVGAVSGGLQATPLAGTVAAYTINVAANGLGSTAQYALTQRYHGEEIDPYTAAHVGLQSTVTAMIVSAPDVVYPKEFGPEDAEFWNMARQQQNATQDFANNATTLIRRNLSTTLLPSVVRSATEYVGSNYIDRAERWNLPDWQ